uniref:C2H2-type domain-containing protein n=1 Tax=Lutzomyia longipalpis TaxID=7200 RepID=A0A1B0GLC4_LUTLO
MLIFSKIYFSWAPLGGAVQLKPYECQQCPAKFSRKPYLDIHYRTHTGERPFECEVCLKRFSQKSSLNIHKTIHTGHKSQFAIHIRTHSAGQNYECNICGRTFIRDSYLIRHHNRVHRENRTTANSIATINSVASGHVESGQNSGNVDFDSNNSQVCDLRYVSELQLNASPAVSQMSSPGIPADRVMMNDRSNAMTVMNGGTPGAQSNDRSSNGSSNGSAGPMDHARQQERAAIQNRVLHERALQERAIQERVMQERALQERVMQQERVNIHTPIGMTGHVIQHDAARIEKNVMPGTIASPGSV